MSNPRQRQPADLEARIARLAENAAERAVVGDPEWRRGACWGKVRAGHPEGLVIAHVEEVLANVERVAADADDRRQLRLVALIHDSFKHLVDTTRPRVGDNHHAVLARRFAERHGVEQPLLELIELHDEAYNAWRAGARDDRWGYAESRAHALISRLGDGVEQYLRFFAADNATGDKSPRSLEWFAQLVASRR